MVGRFLVGLGVGLGLAIDPLYIRYGHTPRIMEMSSLAQPPRVSVMIASSSTPPTRDDCSLILVLLLPPMLSPAVPRPHQ